MIKKAAALTVQTRSLFWHNKRNGTHLVGTMIGEMPHSLGGDFDNFI
jgi:hypothetical protein